MSNKTAQKMQTNKPATQQVAKKETGNAPIKNRSERFKELAPKRTRGVLKSLEVLGNCSNRSGYDYTAEDISKIFEAIEKKVQHVKSKFASTPAAKKNIDFTL